LAICGKLLVKSKTKQTKNKQKTNKKTTKRKDVIPNLGAA
jgi:hypothetical protein